MNMSIEERKFLDDLAPVGSQWEQMLIWEVEDIMIEAIISFDFIDF